MDDDGGRRVLLDVLNDPHALESFLGFGDVPRSPQSSDVSSTADIRQLPAAEVKPVERETSSASFAAAARADGRVGSVSLAVVNPLPKSTIPTNGVSSTTNGKGSSPAVSGTKLRLSDEPRLTVNGARSQPTAPVAPRVSKNRRRSVTRPDASRDSKSPSLSTVLPPNGGFVGSGQVRIVNQPSAAVRPVTPTGSPIMVMPAGSPLLQLGSNLAKTTLSPASHRPIQPKPVNAYAHVHPITSKENSSTSRKAASPAPSRTTSPGMHPQVTPLSSFIHSSQGPRSSTPMIPAAAAASLAPFFMNQSMMMPPPFIFSQPGAGMQFLLRQPAPTPFMSFAQLPMKSGSGSENVATPMMIPGSGGAMLLPSSVLGNPAGSGRQTLSSSPSGPPILHLAAGTTVHLQQIQTPNGVVTVAIPSAGGNPVTLSGMGPTIMTPTSMSMAVPTSVSHTVQRVKTASTGTSVASSKQQNHVRPSSPREVFIPSTSRSENKPDVVDLCSGKISVGSSAEPSRVGVPTSKSSTSDPVIIYASASTKPTVAVASNVAQLQKSVEGKKRKAAKRIRKPKPPASKSVAKSPLSVDQVLLAAVQEAGIGDEDFLYFDETVASPSAAVDNFASAGAVALDVPVESCVMEGGPLVVVPVENGVSESVHPPPFATPAESLPGNEGYLGETSGISTSTCDLIQGSITATTPSRSPISSSPESSALEIVVSPAKTDPEPGVLTIVCDSSKLSATGSSPSKNEESASESVVGSEWRFAEAKPSDIDELCSQLSPIPELSSRGSSSIVFENDTSASDASKSEEVLENVVCVEPQPRERSAPPPPKPKNGFSVPKTSAAVVPAEDPFDAIMKDSGNWGKRVSLKNVKEGREKATESPQAVVRPAKRVAPSRRIPDEEPAGPAPSMPILFEEDALVLTRPISPVRTHQTPPPIVPSPPKIARLSPEVVPQPPEVVQQRPPEEPVSEQPRSASPEKPAVAACSQLEVHPISPPPASPEPQETESIPEEPCSQTAFAEVRLLEATPQPSSKPEPIVPPKSPEPISPPKSPEPILPPETQKPIVHIESAELTPVPLISSEPSPKFPEPVVVPELLLKSPEPPVTEMEKPETLVALPEVVPVDKAPRVEDATPDVCEDESSRPSCSVDLSAWFSPGGAQATLEDCLKHDQDFVLDPLSRFRNPLADGTMECPHPPLRPFRSVDEACASLKSYHVFHEEPDVEAEEEFDRSFEERCQHLLGRIDAMKSRYHGQLLRESMNAIPKAELVMVGRAFVADERNALKQEREVFANGGGRLTPFSPESFNLDINFSRPSSSASLSQISPQILYPPASDASRFCSDIDFRRESESRSSGRFSPPAIEIPIDFSETRTEVKEDSPSRCDVPPVDERKEVLSRNGSSVGIPEEESTLRTASVGENPPSVHPPTDEQDSSGDESTRHSDRSRGFRKKKKKDKKKKHKQKKKKKRSFDEEPPLDILDVDLSSKDFKKKLKKEKKRRKEEPSEEVESDSGLEKSKKGEENHEEEPDEEIVSFPLEDNELSLKERKKKKSKKNKKRYKSDVSFSTEEPELSSGEPKKKSKKDIECREDDSDDELVICTMDMEESESKERKKKSKKDKKRNNEDSDEELVSMEMKDSDLSSKELKKKSKKEKKRSKEDSDEEVLLMDTEENESSSKELKKKLKKEKKRRKEEKRRMKAMLNEKPGSPFPWLKSPSGQEIDIEKLLPALDEHSFDLDESKTSADSWNFGLSSKSRLEDVKGTEVIDLCDDSPEEEEREHRPVSPVSSCSSNSMNQSLIQQKPRRKRKEILDTCESEPGHSLTFKIVRSTSKDKSLCYSFRKPDKPELRISRHKVD